MSAQCLVLPINYHLLTDSHGLHCSSCYAPKGLQQCHHLSMRDQPLYFTSLPRIPSGFCSDAKGKHVRVACTRLKAHKAQLYDPFSSLHCQELTLDRSCTQWVDDREHARVGCWPDDRASSIDHGVFSPPTIATSIVDARA